MVQQILAVESCSQYWTFSISLQTAQPKLQQNAHEKKIHTTHKALLGNDSANIKHSNFLLHITPDHSLWI